MANHRRVLAAVLVSSALAIPAGCTMDPSGVAPPPVPPSEAPVLTSRGPEPAGANCADGGVAIRVGHDRDRDGVLEASEVEHTEYVCAGDAPVTPATLVRQDPISPGAQCATGGAAVHVGVDDNGDGVLEDAEIDQTTIVCDASEIWEGDFSGDLAQLAHVRIVTGALSINSATAVELPALEMVGGNLTVRGNLPALSVPALRRVGGSITVDVPGIDAFEFPALEQIGGALDATGNGVHGTSIGAPVLTSIGGRLGLSWGAKGALEMPRLHDLGGTLALDGSLSSVDLGSLTTLGGDLIFDDDTLTELRLPALRTVAGKLHVYSQAKLAAITLPALEQLGTLYLNGVDGLQTVTLPALTTITGDVSIHSAKVLETVDLGMVGTVGGQLVIANAPALHVLLADHLSQIGTGPAASADEVDLLIAQTGLVDLSLPALTTVGNIGIETNAALRTLGLRSLKTASGFDVGTNTVLETVSVPAVTHLSYLNLVESPAITTFDLGALTTIDRHLDFRDAAVKDLSGFKSLQNVQSVFLNNLRAVTDLRGLSNLSNLSDLELYADRALTSVDGLEHVLQLSSSLTIQEAPALTSLAGFSNLTHVGHNLIITGVPVLTRLDGLDHLVSINGLLAISSADALTSLTALDALTWVGQSVRVQSSASLPQADIDALVHRLAH